VVIVDDHETLREGVKALLLEEPDLAVVGEAADGQQALDLVRRREPDVVLLDVAMPGMDGLEAASRLRERHPALRIIGLSTFSHEDMGERMLEAGADLYLCKSDPGTDLVAAIRQGPSGDGDRRGA
jgi:DNA-binding NarL/FixJ family response regulator